MSLEKLKDLVAAAGTHPGTNIKVPACVLLEACKESGMTMDDPRGLMAHAADVVANGLHGPETTMQINRAAHLKLFPALGLPETTLKT